MQKLVVDTNVVVSSLIGRSYPFKIIYDIILSGQAALFISEEILQEYRGVLNRKKFESRTNFSEAALLLIESIEDISTKIEPLISVDVTPDKADNKFLELALTVQADFLVTGNLKHFPLKEFENTKIVSPKEFLG